MRGSVTIAAVLLALACAAPAAAESPQFDPGSSSADSPRELPPYLQCVPYARERSGVQIFGDAWTWWDQAEGRYKRGNRPRVGAVMAFAPHGNMRLGHVAAVARVIDRRTVLLDHANWSPIDGRRGQIERGVKAIDVSPGNDWSEVRVWYDPLQDLGTTAWPVEGFIYNEREDGAKAVLVRADVNGRSAADAGRASRGPSREFLQAFASLEKRAPSRVAVSAPATRRAAPSDSIGSAVARYDP